MKKKLKKSYKFILKLVIFLVTLFILFTLYFQIKEKAFNKEKERISETETVNQKLYSDCLKKEYVKDDKIEAKKSEVVDYLKKYSTSVKYYDINTHLELTYNETPIYYGASLIKTLDALYIYNEALKDKSILDKTITYTSNYQKASSLGMKNYSFGDKVKVKDLVNYAISYSDNSAHFMLIDYIGFNALKKYGNSLGNKYTLIGGDNYGNINLSDAFNYMVEVNKYLTTNAELGAELRSYFDNTHNNYLTLSNAKALHKYGYYGTNFHDIGIVEGDNPYIIVVLTNHGNGDFKTIVNNISKKINELHNYYQEIKNAKCYLEIYSK